MKPTLQALDSGMAWGGGFKGIALSEWPRDTVRVLCNMHHEASSAGLEMRLHGVPFSV